MPAATTTPTTELPPRYDAAAVQAEVAKVWDDERLFHAEPDESKEPFSVVIPPPNVTAALHLGHALNNTIQDILVRHARMQGKNAVWLPGTDHAGIATQAVVEKRLLATEGKRRVDYARDEFVAKVQAWKDEYEGVILGQLKAMGCSCDFERTAFTMDEPRAAAVREAFFRLFKDGLIYRGKRLVNWDPVTQTALADDEVENEEIVGKFYYLRYPLIDERDAPDPSAPTPTRSAGGLSGESSGYLIVATTRPETMLGDTAVAMNPNDPRAATLRGRKVLLPIVDREIPIVEDDYVVMADPDGDDPKAKFATGFLKVTPAHDPNDWDIGQRHGLDVINVMAGDASISDAHGWTPETDAAKQFVGLSREAAREQIVAWFKANDLLEEVRPYRHSVGHSYRSHVPVEPYLSDQWYVAVQKPIPWMPDAGKVEGTDVPANSLAGLALTALGEAAGTLRGPALRAESDAEPDGSESRSTARSDGPALGDDVLTFVPDRYAKTYWQWNAALRDWCISRQLWWGHRIPVWYNNGVVGGRSKVHDDLTYEEVRELYENGARDDVYHLEYPDNDDDTRHHWWICTTSLQWLTTKWRDVDAAASSGKLPSRRQAREIESWTHKQDPDVLDTWFSSALWPMSTLGWPERTPELAHWNPTSVLCTAREIITLWVSRMVMFNRYLLAHPDERRNADGTPPNARGMSPDLRGRPLESSGMSSQSSGMSSDLRGTSPKSSGTSSASSGMSPNVRGMSSESSGMSRESSGMSQTEGLSDVAGSAATASGRHLPFKDVFIHAMIQDGHGQKMSKSLGNGVDPLDVIDSHGADAMRYTLAGMTTHTQDVRLPVDLVDPHTGETFAGKTFKNKAGYEVFEPVQTHKGKASVSPYGLASGEATASADRPAARTTSSKFDQGRNFANKIWNAGRFVISNLQVHHGEHGGTELQTVDRWILSRLSATIGEVDAALAEYRFDRYATAVYDFFWRDFCDWYVEATKPRMKEGDAVAAGVLASCLDASLRLMHPAMPFVTERLWWALNEARPQRGVEGVIDLPVSGRCMVAAWPTSAFRDEAAEQEVGALREVVEAIRRVRTENKTPPRQTVPVGVEVGDDLRATLELWANCEVVAEVQDAAETTAAGRTIRVGGIADKAADADRVAKERADLEKQIATLRGRLANKGYADRAPAHLVQQTRDQLAAAEAELAKL